MSGRSCFLMRKGENETVWGGGKGRNGVEYKILYKMVGSKMGVESALI